MEDEIVMLKRRLQTELSVSGATAGTLVELTKQLEMGMRTLAAGRHAEKTKSLTKAGASNPETVAGEHHECREAQDLAGLCTSLHWETAQLGSVDHTGKPQQAVIANVPQSSINQWAEKAIELAGKYEALMANPIPE
jgi:hypothetical protein